MASYTDAEMLEVVREALHGNLSKAKSYSINGRSLARYSLSELIAAEKYYQKRVDAGQGLAKTFGVFRNDQ